MNEDNDKRKINIAVGEGTAAGLSSPPPTLVDQLSKLAAKKREDMDKIDSLIMYISQYPEFEENLKILQSLR